MENHAWLGQKTTGLKAQKSPRKAGVFRSQIAKKSLLLAHLGSTETGGRTVVGREVEVFAGLEFGGFLAYLKRYL